LPIQNLRDHFTNENKHIVSIKRPSLFCQSRSKVSDFIKNIVTNQKYSKRPSFFSLPLIFSQPSPHLVEIHPASGERGQDGERRILKMIKF